MEESIHGKIHCRDVPHSRSVRRFVEKRIRDWVRSHASNAGEPSYDVSFWREGEGHLVNCQIAVRTATRIWISAQYGSGLHQALLRCLESLMPLTPQPALSPLG